MNHKCGCQVTDAVIFDMDGVIVDSEMLYLNLRWQFAREKNPEVRVVVNAIALETLFAAQTVLKELGFSDIEVTQLAATRGKPVGAYTMLTANNPVFILSGRAANDTK